MAKTGKRKMCKRSSVATRFLISYPPMSSTTTW
jgi:hypothetical protein